MEYNKYLINFTRNDITNAIENILDVRGVLNTKLVFTLSPFISIEKDDTIYPLDESIVTYSFNKEEGFLYENNELFYLTVI